MLRYHILVERLPILPMVPDVFNFGRSSFWLRIWSPDNHGCWHCHFWQNGFLEKQTVKVFWFEFLVAIQSNPSNCEEACFWRRRRRLVKMMAAAAAAAGEKLQLLPLLLCCCQTAAAAVTQVQLLSLLSCCCQTAASGSREAVQSQKWAVLKKPSSHFCPTNKQTNNRVNPLDQSSTSRILNDGIETGLNRSSEQNGWETALKTFPPTINVYTTSFVYLQLDHNLRILTKFWFVFTTEA